MCDLKKIVKIRFCRKFQYILQDYDSYFFELAEKVQNIDGLTIPLLQGEPSHEVLLHFNKREEEVSKASSVETFVNGLIQANKVELALKKRRFKDIYGKSINLIK